VKGVKARNIRPAFTLFLNYSFIEEDVEETGKELYKRNTIILFENKVNRIYTFKEYQSNEILPVVILILQTNLPPPEMGLPRLLTS